MPDLQAVSAAALLLFLGAASPGPSLVVVVRHTLAGGRRAGAACAMGHGLGFGLYALLAVLGLSALIEAWPAFFDGMQLAGAALLVYLAWSMVSTPSKPAKPHRTGHHRQGFVEGFLVAFLNPKIALFFIAVLSAALHEEMGLATQLSIAAAGYLIDTLWYLTAALALSTGPASAALHRLGRPIDWTMATLLIGMATLTLWRVFT